MMMRVKLLLWFLKGLIISVLIIVTSSLIFEIKQAHLLAGELEVNKTKSLNAVTRHTDTRYKALHVRLKLTCIITSYTHTHRATA